MAACEKVQLLQPGRVGAEKAEDQALDLQREVQQLASLDWTNQLD